MIGRRAGSRVPHFDGDQRIALLKPEQGEHRRTILEDTVHYIFQLMRHKKLILILTSIGALVSMAIALVSLKLPAGLNPLPNVYTATAQLFVQPNQGGLNDVSVTLGLPPEQSSSQSGRGPNYGLIALQFL